MAAKKKLSFEEQLQTVEALVNRMEAGGMSLEESMKQYEEGIKLIAGLEQELAAANQRLTVLRQKADGTEEEVPMEDAE